MLIFAIDGNAHVHDYLDRIRSSVSGMVWPALPDPSGQLLLALQHQLDQTQWWPSAELRRQQLRQLETLLRHAHLTVPYYRERWRGLHDSARPLTWEDFAGLPLLTRGDLQAGFETLKSTSIPAAHGAVVESRTSGSTGKPVRTLKTALMSGLWWHALTLRDHLWHRRDFSGKLAAIRQGVADEERQGWGPATDIVLATGRCVMLPIRTGVSGQLEWLQRHQPDYLLTYPSNVAELARRSLASGIRLQRLREVRAFGELLTPETRELARRAWGVPMTDIYTSDEAGYIALQCPEHEHYHVQSEGVVVEVLDEEGKSCSPGQTGRVVVTVLHNLATPLVRYDIGDFAEVGDPCPCGRGLPVLRRIVGRARNMLVTAGGERFWPSLSSRSIGDIAPVLQYQLAQTQLDLIEVRLVTAAPLDAAQEDKLRRELLSRLPAGLRLQFTYCASIPRSAGGKFEDFVSELAVPRA